MVITEGYNGWKNRETWLVALWLGNTDPYTDERSREIACRNAKLYEKADMLREFVFTICMGVDREVNGKSASMATDLLNDAIQTVDFRAIVEGLSE